MTTELWAPDKSLVAELDEQFASAIAAYSAKPTLITEHANHEESIRTGGYANRTLLELLQNAADAMTGAIGDASIGRVEIVLDPDSNVLYCANSGRPFSKQGLVAITHAHLSGKRGDEIGRFGLGFKSVLAVTDSPQVLSRSVSFEFNSAKAQDALKEVGASGRRLPILRTATTLDAYEIFTSDPIARELSSWASTIVRLPGVENTKRLRLEMETLSSEFLLFVPALREVRLSVLGAEGFITSHVSKDLGEGLFKIERPDGTGDEWFVSDRMHRPTPAARQEVGEAVSREEIKVSIAMPVKPRRANAESGDEGTARGQFWSYFPLQDRTSATAIFNAPWSVNDDRTTLLRNQYNREVLKTLAEMFVELLPRVSTESDPAAHLEYLPARGREATFFGDEVLCVWVPRLAAVSKVIPDVSGNLKAPAELVPLDLTCEWKGLAAPLKEDSNNGYLAWTQSPNTSKNVPHWKCYASAQRFNRLRQLFAVSIDPSKFDEDSRDMKRDLQLVQKRGIQSWLNEWAKGGDVESAANALRVVMANRGAPESEKALVIPTTHGLRAMGDQSLVFLSQVDDLDIEGAMFVLPEFLDYEEMETLLRKAGFRDLDPVAILNARLAKLTNDAPTEMQSKFWEAVVGVSPRDARSVIQANSTARVLVPTQDGGWSWPQRVLDIDGDLLIQDRSLLLDRHRCVPEVAHYLGVVKAPIEDFSFEDEPAVDEYQAWVIAELNRNLTAGDRPIERITLYPTRRTTAGPFSALLLLEEAEASLHLRETWTVGLLSFGDAPWDCEDSDTGVAHRVPSPVRWAVDRFGVLRTTLGYRSIAEAVAPSLGEYRDILPVYEGSRSVADILDLPKAINEVSATVLRDALATDMLPPRFGDAMLTRFILEAAPLAYPGSRPPGIPARVGRILESRPVSSVYIAVTEEQRDYLRQRQRPYLEATSDQAELLVEHVGCKRFEDSFAFSLKIEGPQEPELLLDVFSGLRREPGHDNLRDISLVRAESIAKWVTTEDGVETQSLEYHRDGVNFVVGMDIDERQTLRLISKAFDLGLNNSDVEKVLSVGLEQQLERTRQEALSAETDVERLEVYFGPDDLKEKLPKGLWQGLEAQQLVSNKTRVAELYLSVYGRDTIKELTELFRRDGYPDVPVQWAGRPPTISWLRKMGFGPEYAGQRTVQQQAEFVVPGAVMLQPLHDYQQEIGAKLRDVLIENQDGRRSKAMLVLPTGAGKTRVASQTILQMFIDGELTGPVLWIAQSQELCEQAVQTFSQVWRGLCAEQKIDSPLTVSRLWESHDIHEPDTSFSVVVATDAKIDAFLANSDHSEYDWLARASAVFVDEGHVAGESTRYTRILTWLGVDGRHWDRPLIGLSATPFKGTSVAATKALAGRFGNNPLQAFTEDQNVYSELVKREVLARVRHQVLEGIDVKMTETEADEARRLNRLSVTVLDKVAKDHRRLTNLVDHIRGLDDQDGRSVLVFTPNVLSAQVLAATLRFHGLKAASVSGSTGRQERREVIEQFKRGEIQVLANCDLLTQGFDAPGVTALYIARPTFSPNAYIQMAGRGLRGPRNGGKDECLIVDMADNFGSADINKLLGFRGYEELWQEQQL